MESNNLTKSIGNHSKPPVITLSLSTSPNGIGRSQVEILFECLTSFKEMYIDELAGMARCGEADEDEVNQTCRELESLNLIITDLFTATAKANQQRPETGFSEN